ncbi:hypothetical protein PWT90_07814 [Aphanocladium album]|nr:hypothetical protein PWT90_07814 [Aphanocladium album]
MAAVADAAFPCSIELKVPFPTNRLASTALQAIQVDPELSPLVRRQLSLVAASSDAAAAAGKAAEATTVLRVDYQATTNRMLRVAVNSFMDSLKLVIEVMEQLDEDVLAQAAK